MESAKFNASKASGASVSVHPWNLGAPPRPRILLRKRFSIRLSVRLCSCWHIFAGVLPVRGEMAARQRRLSETRGQSVNDNVRAERWESDSEYSCTSSRLSCNASTAGHTSPYVRNCRLQAILENGADVVQKRRSRRVWTFFVSTVRDTTGHGLTYALKR